MFDDSDVRFESSTSDSARSPCVRDQMSIEEVV